MNLKMITNRKKYASIFKKAICVLTAQLFIVSNLSFAAADMEPVGGPDSKAEKSALAVNTLSLPRDFGTIKERSIGGNGKMVIYIQDAHCNYEAQTNIAKILEYLIKNYNVDFVAVEGADGVVDTSWFKAFPDEDIKKEVADYFMKKGEITGAEFLSITSDYPFTIYGAEDKKYYIENLTSFLESYPYKQEFLKYYTDIKGALEKLKTYIYTKDLRALDLKEAEHKDKKLKFADYVQFLKDTADSKKISIKPFANFNILTEALKFEKNINFDTVNEERAALIDELSKKLSKDALSELVNQSLAFKLGKTDNNTFYSYLAGLAKEKDIVISEDYPNLAQYLIYSRIYSKVDNEKLFEEIDALLASLKESMFTNDDQRALDKLSKDANVTLGFMNIELTNKEYEYYLANKGGFAPSNFTEFINRQSGRLGLSYNIDVPDEKLNNAFNKLIDFYEIALERDGILVGNMLKGMKGKKTDVAVLITGGFHTKGITRHLKDKDASYVVISPTITQDTESPYIAVLTGQKTPFEELIIGKPEVAEVTQLGNAYISDDMLDNFLARIPNYPAAQQDIRDLIKNIKAARRNTLEIYAAAYMAAYLSVYGMDQDYAGMLAFFEIQYETRTGQPRGNLKQVYEYMKGPEAQRAFDELKTTGQTGAIRLKGGELTLEEHRGEYVNVNTIINDLIRSGNAQALSLNGKWDTSDVPITRFMEFRSMQKQVDELHVNFIVITGLKKSLENAGIAEDLVFHPGIKRRSVFMDEEDFMYLLSLKNGESLLMEALKHEAMHIEHPDWSEVQVEAVCSTSNLRQALKGRPSQGSGESGLQHFQAFLKPGLQNYASDNIGVDGFDYNRDVGIRADVERYLSHKNRLRYVPLDLPSVGRRTINVDSELIVKCQRYGIDISELITNAMKESLAVKGENAFKGLLKKPNDRLTMAALSRSKSLFEDHIQNGFIGINWILFGGAKLKPSKEILEILLAVGITHELRHEAGETDEALLTREDVLLATKLAQQKGVAIADILSYLDSFVREGSAFVEGLRANAGTVETLITNVTKLSRVENGIVAGVGLKDIHGRVFTPDNRFFTAEGEYTKELNAFVESLSDKSVREMIAAGIMYYDIRSKFWRDNPAFTVAFALAFAKKLQEKEGKQDGIVLHIAVDGYKKHFETAQIFADALLRTGIFDNGGGVYYWGVINGGDIRNYAQAYRAINKEGGNWVYFTMSHRPEDFLGSKLGMGAEVYCGSDVRHCEGVESGTLYDAIIERDFAPITHAAPDPGKIITIESAQKNNNRVAADMIRATSAPKDMPDNELLKGLSLGVDMGGSPIAQNLVNMLRSLGVTDLVVDHSEVTPDYSTEHIIDPNEHESAAIARIKERARQTKRTWLAVDPDGDRGSIVVAAYYKTTDEVRAYSMTGSELLVLAAENLAINYKAKGLGAPTIISDMRTGLAIKDLEKALNERGYPINVVPHEAGYPFFMRGMAKLNAAVAVENTCHTFTNPLTNSNWGAPEEHNYPGYQGGDNAALFLIYLLGCMKHQWEGRDPISQLQWIRREYGLKDTVVQERKPSLPTEHDKYKYVIADKMKELAVEWFPSSQDEYVINFGDPNVTLVSGVHITHYSIDETTSQRRPDAMILVRFSNTGAGFTISGEGYKEDDLKRMLALGHKLMVTAVNELRGVVTTKEDYKTNGLPEGKQFVFFENDAADLAGKFDGSALQQLQAEFDPAKVGVMYSDTEIGMAQGPTVPRREEGIAELTDVLDNDYLRSVPMIIQNGENVIYLRVDSNLAKIARRCGIDDIEALIGEAVRESLAEGVRGPGAFKGLEVNTITIALLNKSKSPFEDGVQNGFIGVHEALFLKVLRGEVKKEVLEVELAVGITHEFRHEAGEMNECALTLEDIKFVQRLAKEKGVSVFQIQEHMRTFSREGSLFMQKLDELVMLERVEKARDIMPKTVAKYERKDNGTSEAVYLGVIDGKVVERYNLTMGGILPSESLAAGQRQRIFVDKGDEVYIYDRVTGSSIPVLEGEFAAIELKDYDIVTSSGPTTVYVEYEFGPAEGVIQTICENVTPFKGRLLEGPKIKYVCPQNAFKGDSDDEGSMPAAKAFLEEHLHIQAEIIPYTSSLEDVKDKIDLTAKDEHIVVVATRDVLEKADTENPGFVKDLLTKACKMPPITDINDKDKLQDKSFYMLEVLAAGAAVAVTNVADADDLAQLQNIFLALTGESLEREYIYYYLSFGKVQHMLPKGVTLSYAIQQINRWLLKMPAKSEIAGMQDKLDARRKLVYSL